MGARSLRLVIVAALSFGAPLALVASCGTSSGEDGAATLDAGPGRDDAVVDGAVVDEGGRSDHALPSDGGAKIGPGGGSVATPDGVVVTIPSGALAAEQDIRVIATDEAAPNGFVASSKIYRFEPAGLWFSTPITVSFPAPSTPGMVLWSNGDRPDFGIIESTYADGVLTVHPLHFSRAFVGVVAFSLSPSGGQLTVSLAGGRYEDGGIVGGPAHDAGYLPVIQLRYPTGAVVDSTALTLVGSPGVDPAFDAYLFGKAPTVARHQDRLGWYWDLRPHGVMLRGNMTVTMATSAPMPPKPNVIATAFDSSGPAWTNGAELALEQFYPPYVSDGPSLLYAYAAPIYMTGYVTALHECAPSAASVLWLCGCGDPPVVEPPHSLLLDQTVWCHGRDHKLFAGWTPSSPLSSTLLESCESNTVKRTCAVTASIDGCHCPVPHTDVVYAYDGLCGQLPDGGAPPSILELTNLCGW